MVKTAPLLGHWPGPLIAHKELVLKLRLRYGKDIVIPCVPHIERGEKEDADGESPTPKHPRWTCDKEIAAKFEVSETSIKVIIQELFSKAGVSTRSQLVRIAIEKYSTDWLRSER